MLTPTYTRQFERDSKRMLRRGKDPERLRLVMTMLKNEESLPRAIATTPWWVTIVAGANATLNRTGC
jgi:hypothetical protein